MHERISLLFNSPNQCAVFFGFFFVVSAIGLSTPSIAARRPLARVLLFIVFLGSLYFVVLSQSRGAIVGLTGTFIFGIFTFRTFRRSFLSVLLVLLASLLFHWNGVERGIKVFVENGDLSVQNRLSLWDAALAMSWDTRWSGFGRHGFGPNFTAWYQALDRYQVYTSGVSDYITILVYYGGLSLFLFVFFISFLVLCLNYTSLCLEDVESLQCLLAILFFLISGLFSTFLTVPVILVMMLFVVGYSVWLTLTRFLCFRRLFLRIVQCSLVVSLLCLLSCVCLGWIASLRQPIKPLTFFPVASFQAPQFVATPRLVDPKGTVFLFVDSHNDIVNIRMYLRPLVVLGYNVVLHSISSNALDSFTHGDLLLRNEEHFLPSHNRIYLFGVGEGARTVLLLALRSGDPRLGGIICVDPVVSHRNKALDPTLELSRLRGLPIFIACNQFENGRDISEFRRLRQLARANDLLFEAKEFRLSGLSTHLFWNEVGRDIEASLASFSMARNVQ